MPGFTRKLANHLARTVRDSRQSPLSAESILITAASIALLLMLFGCGSGSSLVTTAGPITIANGSGVTARVTSLNVAATAQLSMMPIGDTVNAGVDWTVMCGGNPVTGSVVNGACGTFTPSHTADGAATLFTAPAMVPIGTTITITASVTSNPSQSTTTSLTIVSLPIAVAFYSPPLSSLLINGGSGFTVDVTNDPTTAGVIWSASCGAAACGAFTPVTSPASNRLSSTFYIAPSVVPPGGTVTITATSLTDTTKSISATIPILAPTVPPAPPPIAISLSPATLYAQTTGAARTLHFIANVTNDAATAGVNWKVGCGGTTCGQITSHTASGAQATFVGPTTVPPGGAVTITATSATDPTQSATAVVTVITTAPIVVTLSSSSALPASLTAGSQATLAATVASDPGTLGVNWIATCGSAGACGSFNLSPAHTASGGQIIYTAPAAIPTGGVVTITASSPATTPSNPASARTTITAQPPSVSFLQSPPATLTSTAKMSVSAIVANDVAPGGVTWTVQCASTIDGACGWITPAQTASGATATYTAPPVTSGGTLVTILATSTAAPQVNVKSSPIAIKPSTNLTVSFVPTPPSQVQANSTVSLAAAVANDTSNAGVDWQVCASGCGFFTTQAAIPAIPATQTTPYVPPVAAITSTQVSAWPNNLPLPYTAPLQAPGSGSVVLLVASHADPTAANSATVTIITTSNGPALHGTVLAGVQPVVGASVALYAAGTTGYGSLAAQVYAPGGTATTLTDSSGGFVVPGGYNCPSPGSQMYLVATGGGVDAKAPNPNLALMTALGSCSSLSSTTVVLNEITTVASAFATAPFASNEPLTGNSSYLYLGTSSTNSTGLANAFATVNNLVDVTTGQARFAVPSGNAAAPYVKIDTLADILNACTATSGGVYGDGSSCGTLFTAAAVLGNGNGAGYNEFVPADTLQAIFNIAQHPVTGYGYQLDPAPLHFMGLVSSTSPFQPTVSQQPNDWSLSLNYTNGGGLSPASTVGSFAIDASGDLWITDSKNGIVIEWSPVGAALSPPTGFPAGGAQIGIDSVGDIWISGNGALTELTSLGSPVMGSPFGGVSGGGSDLSIDAQNNIWIADGNGVAEFNNLGLAVSPSVGYTNSGVTGIAAVAVDSSNNIWVGIPTFAELTNPGGQLIVSGGIASGVTTLPEMAADGAGNTWELKSSGQVCKTPVYGGKGTTLVQSCNSGGGSSGGGQQGLNYLSPAGIAMDGAGIVWIASSGGTIPPNVVPINPSLVLDYGISLVSQSLSAGTLRVAVDGSGNIWVLLANNTVTEYVGAATPVVTPIALGLKNRKLAARP